LLAIDAPAITLNEAVVAPETTVTIDGTASKLLLLATVTLDPPAGAVCVNVTVQVADCPALNEVGEQTTVDKDETAIVAPPADAILTLLPLESAPTGFDI
jgi:hypothetical protein